MPPRVHRCVPQLAILLACIFWSLGTIYMRNAQHRCGSVRLVGIQMLLGGVWMVARRTGDSAKQRGGTGRCRARWRWPTS